jgi:mannose-6-phosphate isomerase-like protein (cupin superfamily)
MIRRHQQFTWEGIDIHPYKEDGNTFRNVTRQTIFKGAHDLPVELRYFEVGVGGHSTLERHQHAHLVTIIRGSGEVLVGDQVSRIGQNDVVEIAPMTWHQFRATCDEPLGFLCVVSQERDRPQRPDESQLAELRLRPEVAAFIRF